MRWAWLAVVLSGLFPFASDMSRNFQLFSARQLVVSFAGVIVGTSALFVLAWGGILLVQVARRRAGWGPSEAFARVVFALGTAGVFAAFLYDSNMVELRQSFGLSSGMAAACVVIMFLIYAVLAATLGPKRTCALLAAALMFRLAQAGVAVSDATTYGDALMAPEEIAVYQGVELSQKPNIYCICLESYHNFAAMQELYDFDNHAFREFLETNEFSVEEGIYANYWHTMSSLHSFMRMGHHYATGTFGVHDSLYARGFVSGSRTYYNPVLQILKRNGYSIAYLLPSDYYYRPGAGLVDVSLLAQSWPLAPLKVSLPRFIGREPDTVVPEYKKRVGEAVAAWPRNTPAFFFIKLGLEHAAQDYDYRVDRADFVTHYVRNIPPSNASIEALCRQIIEKDPEGIILLMGDHGAQSYKVRQRGFQETAQLDGLPSERLADDVYAVLLAIRWGEGQDTVQYPYRSLANVMRFVFYRLSHDESLLATAAPDDSYLMGKGVLYRVVEDGHPLPEWKAFPRGSLPDR